MQKLYEGLAPKDAFLEFTLEILTQCLSPEGFVRADSLFTSLKEMLIAEHASQEFTDQLHQARLQFNMLGEVCGQGVLPSTPEYNRRLTAMRDILLTAAYTYKAQ